jgi:hypothetical protein
MKYIFNPSIIQGFTCYHFFSYKRGVWYTVKPGLTYKPVSESKDITYYDNASVGHNKLGTFMTEISRMAKLSHEYTNHSCRATTVHVLDEAQVPSRHIARKSILSGRESCSEILLVFDDFPNVFSLIVSDINFLFFSHVFPEYVFRLLTECIMITLVWAIINLEHL